MNFNNTASQIIENSIISSIYIDDKVVEPFEELTDRNSTYFSVSKGLYTSFRAKNKSIDFYKFELGKDWRQDTEYILKHRDLLVLDWQLDDNKELKQSDTLEILHEAINTDNLHFISIYTATETRHFTDIFYQIKAYFEIGFNNKAKETFKKLINDIEAEGIDSSFINELKGRFKEVALRTENKELLEDLKKIFQDNLKEKVRLFYQCLKAFHPNNIIKQCEIFGYCLNDEQINANLKRNYDLNFLYIGSDFVLIDHTIVQLTNKSNPKPDEHFDIFTKALLQVCGNPLTLTSLEIRNLLRDSSGFIGKDADSINDAALYYHKSRKQNFFDFILGIWKSHALSFVDHNSNRLLTLNEVFWKEYENENNISEKVNNLTKPENETLFYKELSKLNTYYNSLHLAKIEDEKIRFGDIFICKDGNYKNDFFLNITAHCDCEEPSVNIKNNFYFLIGKRSRLDVQLKKKEEGFNSYLKLGDEFIAIEWNSRPVVLNVPKNEMINYTVATKDGIQKDIPLTYIGTLKENYAQRMANNSFSFAMRVGIDFASI